MTHLVCISIGLRPGPSSTETTTHTVREVISPLTPPLPPLASPSPATDKPL